MPSTRQKKVAEKVVLNATLDKPLTGGQIVESSGYGPSMKKNPQVVLESQGVQEALAELGFTESNAKSVVAEILLDPDQDGNVRLNAAKEVFKVTGSYAAEKTMALNVNLEGRINNEEAETLRLEYEEKLKAKYLA